MSTVTTHATEAQVEPCPPITVRVLSSPYHMSAPPQATEL